MPPEVPMPVMKPAPAPKPSRGGKKLLGLIILFFVTLFIILFFQSSISKITEIHVEGNELVPVEEIVTVSGVVQGDHFFLTSENKVEQRLRSHPFIEGAEVVKTFPGVMTIRIKEYRRVAFQLATDGTKEVLLADGSALPVAGQAAGVPLDMPILSGWLPEDPMKVLLCGALSKLPPHLLSDISEIIPEPSTAYPDKIKLYTRSRYEVYTTIEYLPGNIEYLGFFTSELKERGKPTGVITMLEQVRHADFADYKPVSTPLAAPEQQNLEDQQGLEQEGEQGLTQEENPEGQQGQNRSSETE